MADDLVKSLVNNGVFGNVSYVSLKLENDVDKGTQFASVISFMTLTVSNGTDNLTHRLVIKKQHVIDQVKDLFNSDISFRNEVIMYNKILPLLECKQLNLFPKLYSGIENENSLVFENLQDEGYRVTTEKVFLDYQHIRLALTKLGEFHALSYIAKKKCKDTFYKLANELIETKFTTEPLQENRNVNLLYPCMNRGIKPLIEQNIQVDLLNKVTSKLSNTIEIAKALLTPEEPFSVICHGDFCRNNMFFKYNQDKPIDIKFFDLQNAVYASPAVDLSFFLYMNTTPEIRNEHWEEFLTIYWMSIIKLVPNIEFNFLQFMEHFSKRALYGYFPTCFFLPTSLEENPIDIEQFGAITLEEQVNLLLLQAGDRGTKAISDIVKHLLEMQYLHKFLEL